METQSTECPFCTIADESVILTSEQAFAISDGYPVSPGHTLVIPRQHVATLFELPRHEQLALWDLVERVRERLVEEHHPDGFNIGLNDGIAAECRAVRLPTHVTKTVVALFGETPLGLVGAGLQWITIVIVVVAGVPDVSLSWRFAMAPLGIATLVAGIVIALRGKSLGPLIVIPGVLGIALVVLLAAIFYPLKRESR